MITAPRYDAAFSDANAVGAAPAGGWIDQLRSDPRQRGAAGLGAWNAIAWQDRIADAAAAKAGDLAIARDRIRHVAFGVEVSRSLWRRRLPTDPVARLAVLAPALGRLATTTGASVLDTIAGRTPGTDTRAVLVGRASGAAARSGTNGADRERAARRSAPCSPPPTTAATRPDAAAIRRDRQRSRQRRSRELVFDAAGGDKALADTVLNALGDESEPGQSGSGAARAGAGRAAAGPIATRSSDSCVALSVREPDRTILEWRGWMREHGHREPCRPIDLDRLAAVVAAAIDPTVARPPAVERVLSTLPGITHIGPVEIEPELDLPLWSFLSERAPDWMLPGAGDLIDGDVVGLSTNPAFVEALLVGANHQATAELRWRNCRW